MEGKKPPKNINEPYLNQISVLKTLADEGGFDVEGSLIKHWQIFDLVERSGIKDEKEMLRLLYILEGQKLVCPVPPGDFTSKIWAITKDGVRALKSIGHAAAA